MLKRPVLGLWLIVGVLPWVSASGCADRETLSEVRRLRGEVAELRREVHELRDTRPAKPAAEAVAPKLPRKTREEEIRALVEQLADDDLIAKYRAGWKLSKIGPEATTALLKALETGKKGQRASVLVVLARIKDKRSEPALVEVLRSSEHGSERSLALVGLGEIRSALAEELALHALESDDNRRVRSAAITVLGRLGSKAAVEKLLPYLGDRDPVIRRVAKESLVRICKKDFPEAAAIYKRSDMQARAQLVGLLAELNNGDANAALMQAYRENNVALRLMAAQALAGHGNTRGVPFAKAQLNSPTPAIHKLAAATLRAAGYKVQYDRLNRRYVAVKAAPLKRSAPPKAGVKGDQQGTTPKEHRER